VLCFNPPHSPKAVQGVLILLFGFFQRFYTFLAYVLAFVNDNILCVVTENAGWLILSQNNGIVVNIYLQRVLFRDIQGSAKLDWQYYTPEFIYFSYYACRFQIKASPYKKLSFIILFAYLY